MKNFLSLGARWIVSTAIALLSAGSAVALQHTYPGNLCVPVTGDHPNQSLRVITDENGQIFNGSPSQSLEVVCPVIGPWDDLSEGLAEVWVTDRNQTENVCCEARLNNVGAIRVGTGACSEDTDTRVQTLQMEPPVFNFSFTARYFVCTIPPAEQGQRSGVLLYRY